MWCVASSNFMLQAEIHESGVKSYNTQSNFIHYTFRAVKCTRFLSIYRSPQRSMGLASISTHVVDTLAVTHLFALIEGNKCEQSKKKHTEKRRKKKHIYPANVILIVFSFYVAFFPFSVSYWRRMESRFKEKKKKTETRISDTRIL